MNPSNTIFRRQFQTMRHKNPRIKMKLTLQTAIRCSVHIAIATALLMFGDAYGEGIVTGYHIGDGNYIADGSLATQVIYSTGQAGCDAIRDNAPEQAWLIRNGFDPTATYPYESGTYATGSCWLVKDYGWVIGTVLTRGQTCINGSAPDLTKPVGQQCLGNKSDGPSCKESTPHPIHTATGNKYWSDTDYASAAQEGVKFIRQYNSHHTLALGTLGTAWLHNYDRKIVTGLTINGANVLVMKRPSGVAYIYVINGSTYTSQDADVVDQLSANLNTSGTKIGWKYYVANDNSTEVYDNAGKLLTITSRTGVVQTLTYSDSTTPATVAPSANMLLSVVDSFGRKLSFVYDSNGRIATMTDPANAKYTYSYDANNNLVSVTYPDTKTKTYLYNESAYTGGTNLPNAMTGIVDENNVRYATYWYDAHGRAYKEQHAGGVDQYQVGYSSDGSNSTITDPLGTTRTTNFTIVLGVIKGTGQSQPGGAGCGASSNAVSYDANGNVASKTDFNGNVTTYQYDLMRDLETSRTEASGTPQARTISTQWHPTYRLPVVIAEPLRLTTFNYDNAGNLQSKTIQATTDTNGSQRFNAQVTGTPRTWSYTYNQYGQVLTAKGPRTDVNDTTSYAYDSATGNLQTITNAAGQVTTLSNYDLNGRVGTITDPNGLVTSLTYYPRGWLHTKTVRSADGSIVQPTTYQYDGVGQLTNVTLPDNSTITYTYDPAHRLTDIVDSFNDSIHYTLDAMGNRTDEQIKDPNSTLTRHISRLYDALDRLQQVTGAAQ
jgi:YD repeat-containing protein